jgi:glycosyltransferase involved in cell wall biosynthesis
VKIAFDCRYVRTDHHDGISRFSARLVEHLVPLAEAAGHSVTMLISEPGQLDFLPAAPSVRIGSPTSAREPLVAASVNKFGFDVVFSPMQTMGSWRRRYKLILTVHDLIYYRHPTPPRQFNVALRLLWRAYHLSWVPQRLLLRGSDAVVAVSETTAQLINEHHLTSRPVYVVHNAAEAQASNHSTASAAERQRSLVYMGSFMPYKNVETLARALHQLPGYQLHLLSRISSPDRARLAALAPADSLVFHNGTTDEEYMELLGQATALVTASRDEGFGIPLVEAMSVGTPVVVSDIPIFHEIGGDAAFYADPDKADAFAAQIQRLEDQRFWLEHSQRSIRQAALFSWQRSAEKLLDVLVEVGSSESFG